MNCDQFYDRLQWLLDNRQEVMSDPPLSRHCDACDACRDRLHLWGEIEQVSDFAESDQATQDPFVLPTTRPARIWSRETAWTALAAAAMLVVTFMWWTAPSSQPLNRAVTAAVIPETDSGNQSSQRPKSQTEPIFAEDASLAWRNGEWWSVVTDEDWVTHTMPAVDSVRQGVAPIGRSMRQAFAILMTSRRESTLPAESHSPNLQPANFGEQTSVIERGNSLSTIV